MSVPPFARRSGYRCAETVRHTDTGRRRVNAVRRNSHGVVIEATTPQPAPRWALLERQLLEAQSRACERYFARYFDERGYLLCVPRWSGDDGPDDALENL